MLFRSNDTATTEIYPEALTLQPFARFFLNSAFLVVMSTSGTVLTSAIVGYSFARLRWVGKNVLFVVVLATMMLPTQVTIIPTFVIFRSIGWIDTFYPLWVPAWLGGSAFHIFLFRQFFMSIPRDLDEAARIDGASTIGIFWRILLPLSRPAVIASAIFHGVWVWNDYFGPLIYLRSHEHYTVALGLQLFQGQHHSEWTKLMAASLAVAFPILLLFLIFQKWFLQGLRFTGVKG